MDSISVFHVTPAESLRKIRKRALLPAVGPRSRKVSEARPLIHLFRTPGHMNDALLNWLLDEFPEDCVLVALEIQLPADFPIEDDPAYPGAICTSSIPIPERFIARFKVIH